MAALPYIQLYIADYLADTAHLTTVQHGAYLLLIFNYWQRGHALNNANGRLASVVRMSNEEWAQNEQTLAEFFEIDGDEWINHRIDADLAAVEAKSTKASMAGKASGATRRANAKRKPNVRSTNVERTPNHTEADTDTDKSGPADADLLGASKGDSKGRNSTAVEIDTWLRSLDGDAILADDPIFGYAKDVGIPLDFLELSWHRFVDAMRDRKKRQKDWRATYRNAVKDNWFKLWWPTPEGDWKLTAAGEQARRAYA